MNRMGIDLESNEAALGLRLERWSAEEMLRESRARAKGKEVVKRVKRHSRMPSKSILRAPIEVLEP